MEWEEVDGMGWDDVSEGKSEGDGILVNLHETRVGMRMKIPYEINIWTQWVGWYEQNFKLRENLIGSRWTKEGARMT